MHQYEAIPDTYINYWDSDSKPSSYELLLSSFPTERLVSYKLYNLRYIKISFETAWYILATLKIILPQEYFEYRVGVRERDSGLMMIDVASLSLLETGQALYVLKQLLIAYNCEPADYLYHRVNVPYLFNCICSLCRDSWMNNTTLTWDEITEETYRTGAAIYY